MNIILLSGGSGKRLWPLSNEVRSKQFLKLFKTENGEYESMVQRMYRQILEVDPNANITIATSKDQVASIHNQLNGDVSISIEPCRRDTFPAIALATAYLHDVKGISEEEAVVVCPADPYVDRGYFEAIMKLEKQAEKGEANLVLMGMEPTYPSEKYGYIIPDEQCDISKVKTFKEKPDEETAKSYLNQGALWNGGVFAYKVGYVLDRARDLLAYKEYYDLFARYDSLAKISFDYAVVEHEDKIQVMKYSGTWDDLGTWNALTEVMEEDVVGDVIRSDNCENISVINELDMPLLCVGLHDLVISASTDGILVSDKAQSDQIKPYVDKMNNRVMYAEKSWGSFRIIDIEEESVTIKVTLNPGHKMNYHSHERRDEVWNIISGEGMVIVDGMEQKVQAGDVITMQAGCRHTIIASTELKIIEVQLGKEISINDKQKHELEFA